MGAARGGLVEADPRRAVGAVGDLAHAQLVARERHDARSNRRASLRLAAGGEGGGGGGGGGPGGGEEPRWGGRGDTMREATEGRAFGLPPAATAAAGRAGSASEKHSNVARARRVDR